MISTISADIAPGKSIFLRAMVMQHKTRGPVRFALAERTRQPVAICSSARQTPFYEMVLPTHLQRIALDTRSFREVLRTAKCLSHHVEFNGK
ncbi:hypothetical protein [Noviherbaspirillum suwonense]|uniref:hypothetical protein n=1 Tax=Noviherbaspirillum suwonense TaxID=1224511 RepID=UPI0024B73BA9|nr:hypothetical protein [Noviherbaspirillum suwonense]